MESYHVLWTCTSTGRDCGTATAIFTKIDSVISHTMVCVGFGIDYTSVNVGLRHSIIKEQNDARYFMDVHNIAGHASEANLVGLRWKIFVLVYTTGSIKVQNVRGL